MSASSDLPRTLPVLRRGTCPGLIYQRPFTGGGVLVGTLSDPITFAQPPTLSIQQTATDRDGGGGGTPEEV